jgi:aminopeptidase N
MWTALMAAAVAWVDPGISEELARQRAAQIRDIHYELNITVPREMAEPLRGRARIWFANQSPAAPVVLDFAPGANLMEGSSVPYQTENGHLIFPAGTRELELEFRLGDAPLNRQANFFYSLFVPARAHLAIPCFDQPDLKARYTVNIAAPAGWQVLTNAEPGQATPPISTYHLFFAAGEFQVETAMRNGRRMRFFHRETDRAKVERNLEAIFDLHGRAIQWLEDYTGIAFPFPKFDFMALPSFQFGGMEHPGAISYNSAGLFLDPSATQAQYLARASLISHETAHMWFGDLVTMRWFNDVWLKEVFANFMAAKMVNPSFPELNHELRFFLNHYRAAYNVDRTAGTNAIRQPLANLNEAGTLYGPIIYQKAPIVMRQLEEMLGEAGFRDAVREYLRQYAFGNATWDELIAILDRRTREDLVAFSRVWIDTPGRPRVRRTKKYEGFQLPAGYGEYRLDARSRAFLLRKLPEIADPLVRAEAWSALWEDHVDLFELALRAIPAEREELNLQRLLNDFERLVWRRPGREAAAEKLLRAGLEQAATASMRAAYFQAYQSVAPVEWLEGVFAGKIVLKGLPLAEADYMRLGYELGLRGVDVRDAVREKLKNPDRRAQFEFVVRALDGDGSAFFASLQDVRNRAREAWVLEGLALLHHPRRLASSEKYIAPSLELLREIQRTGDIFFPQRWMNTTLGWYRSASAARTVREFLAGLPADYPPRLRNIILVAADELFRLSKAEANGMVQRRKAR